MTKESLLSLVEVRSDLGCFARCKWSLIVTTKIDEFFILNFAGGAAMKAAETLREEGFRGNKLK